MEGGDADNLGIFLTPVQQEAGQKEPQLPGLHGRALVHTSLEDSREGKSKDLPYGPASKGRSKSTESRLDRARRIRNFSTLRGSNSAISRGRPDKDHGQSWQLPGLGLCIGSSPQAGLPRLPGSITRRMPAPFSILDRPPAVLTECLSWDGPPGLVCLFLFLFFVSGPFFVSSLWPGLQNGGLNTEPLLTWTASRRQLVYTGPASQLCNPWRPAA